MPGAFSILSSPFLSITRKKKKKNKIRKRTKKFSNSRPSKTIPIQIQPNINKVDSESEVSSDSDSELGFNLKPSSSSQNHIIQPLGNLLLLNPSSNIRNPGLGNLQILSDELLIDLLSLLRPCDLAILSSVSKSLFVFSQHDPLWRNLALHHLNGNFCFAGTWKSTYISSLHPQFFPPTAAPLRIRNFYSDHLFQSWLCANMEMKPEWLARDNIERRRNLSLEEFVARFEDLNKPVLLEGCMDFTRAMGKWSRENLVKICGDVRFAVGPVEMTMEKYFEYAESAKEERPLYLFDSKFAEKVAELGSDYDVPEYFKEDLFSVLGKERPDYRWIIIGPAGSGSSFHVDPNSTSAWNAVIRGSKKWVMFPPEVVPPGVHPSPDGSEVACPVSIMEWFMNFYGASMKWKKRPIECVCKAGEVVFVPNGWWHLVINLEDSIAITQNYVSRRNLLNVLDFLKRPNASELVSGTADRVNLHDKFRASIEAAFPGTIDQLAAVAKEKMAQSKKLNFWESATDACSGGFRFYLT